MGYPNTPEGREAKRLYSAKWRAAHLEESREASRRSAAKRQADDPEKVRQIRRKSMSKWSKDHPEEKKRRDAEYYANNRDKVGQNVVEWRAANPENVRATRARRRAKKLEAPGFATTEQIQARFAYFGNCCWMCGGPAEAVDHVKPLSLGGSNWAANLRPACTSCNSRKHNIWYGVAGLWRFIIKTVERIAA